MAIQTITETIKQTNREKLREITDSIEKGIKELFSSDRYRQYLTTMSRFPKYSVNNQMLIYMQMPEATRVAGYRIWHNRFGRDVREGQHGIRIIAPVPYKKNIEQEKIDPVTNRPVVGEDGKTVMEEKEVRIPMFRPVTVFDVSQTEGRPLPRLATDLQGSVPNYGIFMEALRRTATVPVLFEPMNERTDGFYDRENRTIHIREGMSEIMTVSALLHEIAHSKLHDSPKEQPVSGDRYEGADPVTELKDRATREVEAESVSFAVCAYYGIATGENSFGYIAGWSRDRDLRELRASLETINRTSCELITDIDRNYAYIMKERSEEINADDTDKAPAPEQEEKSPDPVAVSKDPSYEGPAPDPQTGTADMISFGYTDTNMLPLSKDRALELFESNIPVCLLYADGTEAEAVSAAEITKHEGLFGITRDDWEAVKDKVPARDIEKRFSDSPEDAILIYQLSGSAPENLRFLSYITLKEPPTADNYRAVYTQPLYDRGPRGEVLEDIFDRFNIDRPADFFGHNLSVSDVVALKRGSEISYHYCDSVGFKQLEGFIQPESPEQTEEQTADDGRSRKGQENKQPASGKTKEPAPGKTAKIKKQIKKDEMEI